MKRHALLVGFLLALISVPLVFAAPKNPSGTITLATPPPYSFGSNVTFATTTADLKGNQYPMVYVVCYSVVDNTLLYGQLDQPDTLFVLGGGSSQWHTQRDDANCRAYLYAYGGKSGGVETIIELAVTSDFFATG